MTASKRRSSINDDHLEQNTNKKRQRHNHEGEATVVDEKYHEILQRLPPAPRPTPRYCGVSCIQRAIVVYRDTSSYLPLLPGEIRLAKLYAGRREDQLRVDLIHLPLAAVTNLYEALSYAWGAHPLYESLILQHQSTNGRSALSSMAIRPSLAAALRCRRHLNEDIMLWADAICINQSDDDEKSRQIRMMGDIYNQAATVCVWLGKESPASRAAMDFLHSILMPGFCWDFGSGSISSHWNALSYLLKRPWFGRLWVVQEISASRSAIVHCGGQYIHWDDFSAAIGLLEANSDQISKALCTNPEHGYDDDPVKILRTSGALQLVKISGSFKRSRVGAVPHSLTSLESLVSSLTQFEATDARDHIYALLGIAWDVLRGEDLLKPDYTKSVLEVYRDFIAFAIKQSSSLDIILRGWAPMSRWK